MKMDHTHQPDQKKKGEMKNMTHARGHHNHKDHHKNMARDFKKRFFVSIILSLPIILLSPMVQSLLGYTITFRWSLYLLFVLSSVIFFYGGRPFLTGLITELKAKTPGMMTLIALAIGVAFIYSSAVIFGFKGKLFYWELATLIDIMLLGHWIEMRSIMGASRALEKLAALLPDTAHRLDNGNISDVPVQALSANDLILVKPGEKVPADGTIKNGESYLDESMLTGESKPVHKGEADMVIAGSLNGSGALEVMVEHTSESSYISKVITLVREAQSAKSKTERLADRAARWLTLISITAGAATLAGWIIAGQELAFAIERMATVMIITCPHALGLAIPLVVAVSTARSAKKGLLIRNRTAFELSRKITTVIFDKTGTLTQGNFGVTGIDIIDKNYTDNDILMYAASIENYSEHPIAQGIIAEAEERGTEILTVENTRAIKGKGIIGTIKNTPVGVVSPGYIAENGLAGTVKGLPERRGTTVYCLYNGKLIGAITLADAIRDESKGAVTALQRAGIKCWMLTGDNKETAQSVSQELGLDGFYAEVLPHEKQEKLRELQAAGEIVAMTGDGINDAPALAAADVGIAIGSGTDVAAETADIILVNSNPQDVSSLILFGKNTYRKMIQNLIWATGYNVIAIPLGSGLFYSFGLLISPAMGAVLMSISTIIVAINARMLKFG